MGTLIFDCPNCSAKHSTFDVKGYYSNLANDFWEWEFFSICRSCTSVMIIKADVDSSVHQGLAAEALSYEDRYIYVGDKLRNFIDQKDAHLNDHFSNFRYQPILKTYLTPPDHLPKDIEDIFIEASKCLSIGCFNVSAAMFRLCLDIVTKKILELNESLKPTRDNKKSIHTRLSWIFEHNILHKNLEELSRCIKDDGNDGAHDGNIGQYEADDLFDFTYEFLEHVYTQPARVQLAKERRQQRRQS
ncbi:DUF4145 domain-containing protein [Acinetobacter baumannii]|uniref:DUF4145 domain-containing protein n=1 Tax=Acinetobacter baumannii TaxID=470 RepID=UPI001C439FB3|nr:DUF4145 domain-containing protein [Acinetobacter baumannii]MBV6567613.1 DUF4145 domain-containing protein [Acinetobacter baumannii]